MPKNRLIFIWIVLTSILTARFPLVFMTPSPYKAGQDVSFSATLLVQPRIAGNTQRFELNGIRIVTSAFPRYLYGDELTIEGRITRTNARKEITGFTIFFPKIALSNQEKKLPGLPVLALFGSIRQTITSVINQTLPSSPGALLSGIVLGSSEGFSDDFWQALRNTGTLHVVAASGMNVSLVASFCMGILLRFMRRPVAAGFVVGFIILYTCLALFQPSIVRAAIMGGIAFGASMLNRQIFTLWSFTIAAFLMLLVDPRLIFDIGFQLSFAATAGILFLKPMLEATWQWFHTIGKVAVVGDSLTTTLVAQATTLPILLSNFGTISIVSIAVNTLVLWVVQPIMALGIVGAILSIVPYLSKVPILAALPFLAIFESVVKIFNRPEFLINAQIPFLAGVGYYFLLLALYFALKSRA